MLKPFIAASGGGVNVFACSDRPTIIYSNSRKLLFSSVNLKVGVAQEVWFTVGCYFLRKHHNSRKFSWSDIFANFVNIPAFVKFLIHEI